MSTCSNCKYWQNKTTVRSRSGTSVKLGECGLVDSRTGDQLFDSGHGMGVTVTADDDSGLWSTLQTGENFGCINFQQRG